MTTYKVFLRNGECIKVNADGYSRMRGTFHVKIEAEEGKNNSKIIADFDPKELVGVVEDESVVN